MKNWKTQTCLLIIFMLIISFSKAAYGQEELSAEKLSELNLEDLLNVEVVTASKKGEKISDAPAVVSVVTAKEIESFGAKSLGDVLDRVVSVYFFGTYIFPASMTIVRGGATDLYNTQILYLLDGRPLSESLTRGHSVIQNRSLPLSIIERVEIIRGPGSVLYGTGAMLGVINIITKTAEATQFKIDANYGSFNTAKTELTGTAKIGDLAIIGAIQYFDSKGWDFTALGETDAVRNKTNTGDSLLRGPTSVKYFQKNLGATLKASYKNFTVNSFYGSVDQENIARSPIWLSPADHANSSKQLFVDGGYFYDFSNKWTASLNVTYNYYWLNQYRPLDAFKDDEIRRNSNDYLVELTNYIKPLENLNIVVGASTNTQTGVQYQPELSADGKAFDIKTGENPNPMLSIPEYNYTWYTGYAQADYTPLAFLKLIAGGQLNKVPSLDADFVPRLGAIFTITEQIRAKVLYGQAFRSASAFETRTHTMPTIIGNPNLLPEKVRTFETQLSYSASRFEAALTYFNSFLTNQIIRSLASDSLYITTYLGKKVSVPYYINRGELTLQGVELEGKAIISNELTALGSYSIHTTKDQNGHMDYSGTPKFMVKLGLQYTSPFGLNVGVFNSFFSKGGDITAYNVKGQQVTKNANPNVEAYNYLSMNVSLDITKLMELQNMPSILFNIYGENLLDESIYYPENSRRNINSLPGRPGRAVYAGIGVKF